MPNNRLSRGLACCMLLAGLAGGAALARAPDVADTFASVMGGAMARMHHDMMVPSSGDADRDFAAMMIPHHQGAIEMAAAELRFGKDAVLRRLAQEIVVSQGQEVVVMRQALDALPAPTGATPGPAPAMHHH